MDKNSFKTCISSDHRLLDLHLKETLQYRDLIFLFVKRDFVAKYKQTILGPLWAIIQPLLTTVVFTVIFGSLAKLTTAAVKGDYFIPAFLFGHSGLEGKGHGGIFLQGIDVLGFKDLFHWGCLQQFIVFL